MIMKKTLSPTNIAAQKVVLTLPEQNDKSINLWRIFHLQTDDLNIVKDTICQAAGLRWGNRKEPLFISIEQLMDAVKKIRDSKDLRSNRPNLITNCYNFRKSLTEEIILPNGNDNWIAEALNEHRPVFVYMAYFNKNENNSTDGVHGLMLQYAQYMEQGYQARDYLYNNLFFVIYGNRCLLPEILQHYLTRIIYPDLSSRDFSVLLNEYRNNINEKIKEKATGKGYSIKEIPEITEKTVRWYTNHMSGMGETRVRQLLTEAEVLAQGGMADFNELENMDTVLIKYKNNELLKSGRLKVMPVQNTHNIGNVDEIKNVEAVERWFKRHINAAKAENNSAKGIFLVGMPGTGKSAVAKIAARKLDMPLVKFDIASILGSYVGESEKGMRAMLEDLKLAAPCVLWIDEIEKALSGSKSGGQSGDGSSVMQRLMGQLLEFMQDRNKPVFLVVTANSLEPLPSEFYRNDRFDAVFAFMMPDYKGCHDIMEAKLQKYFTLLGWENYVTNTLIDRVLDACMGTYINPHFLSGADIEQYAKELYWYYDDNFEKKFPGDISVAETMKTLAMDLRVTASAKNTKTMRNMANTYLAVMRDSFVIANQSQNDGNRCFSSSELDENVVRYFEFNDKHPEIPVCFKAAKNCKGRVTEEESSKNWYDMAFYRELNKAMVEVILQEDETIPKAREEYYKLMSYRVKNNFQ